MLKLGDLSMKQLKSVISIKGKEIEVKHYLPIEDKLTLIQITAQQAQRAETGIINDILFDAYFNTYVIFFYTNLEFTDEQKENPLEIYNILASNDLISQIEAAIPQPEFDELFDFANKDLADIKEYRNSFVSVANDIMTYLPTQMEKVGDIVNNFDPSKYQAVIDFATAANGGRNINTNHPVE